MIKPVNKAYRIDLELVNATDLVKIQTKLNQWITNGTLLKFDVTPVGDKMLFRIVRLREDISKPAAVSEDDAPF